MTEFTRVAIDTSKHVFTIYAVTTQGEVVRRELRRERLLPFFTKLAPTEVVMEACSSSHDWGRELPAVGHGVRLLPPQSVKPFVCRSKNDDNDAEGIWVAAGQPSMVSTPVKSLQQQADAMLGGKGLLAWLEALLKRKPRKLAAVALANKMARIAWAMRTSGEAFRLLPQAG
jgi:transposase